MTTLLCLGPAEQANIKRLVEYATAHPINAEEFKRRAESHQPVGNDYRHVCIIPMGYICVFSIEEHPCGWCRHISISLHGAQPDHYPNEHAVLLLIKEFGFWGGFEDCEGWFEAGVAINLAQPLTPDTDTVVKVE